MSFWQYWQTNLRRTFREWEWWESAMALIAFVVTAFGVRYFDEHPTAMQWVATVVLLFVVLELCVVTPWRMWRDSQHRVRELEALAEPRLEIVFHPDKPPYLQELHIQVNGKLVVDRRYRIGLKNVSSQVIRNVRVVLESFEQLYDGKLRSTTTDQPIFLEHALGIMGREEKHGFVDVAPGDRPTAFADVIEQTLNTERTSGDWMSPCYASGIRTTLFSRGTFVFVLRVEGGGSYARERFKVGATLEDRPIAMSSY